MPQTSQDSSHTSHSSSATQVFLQVPDEARPDAWKIGETALDKATERLVEEIYEVFKGSPAGHYVAAHAKLPALTVKFVHAYYQNADSDSPLLNALVQVGEELTLEFILTKAIPGYSQLGLILLGCEITGVLAEKTAKYSQYCEERAAQLPEHIRPFTDFDDLSSDAAGVAAFYSFLGWSAGWVEIGIERAAKFTLKFSQDVIQHNIDSAIFVAQNLHKFREYGDLCLMRYVATPEHIRDYTDFAALHYEALEAQGIIEAGRIIGKALFIDLPQAITQAQSRYTERAALFTQAYPDTDFEAIAQEFAQAFPFPHCNQATANTAQPVLPIISGESAKALAEWQAKLVDGHMPWREQHHAFVFFASHQAYMAAQKTAQTNSHPMPGMAGLSGKQTGISMNLYGPLGEPGFLIGTAKPFAIPNLTPPAANFSHSNSEPTLSAPTAATPAIQPSFSAKQHFNPPAIAPLPLPAFAKPDLVKWVENNLEFKSTGNSLEVYVKLNDANMWNLGEWGVALAAGGLVVGVGIALQKLVNWANHRLEKNEKRKEEKAKKKHEEDDLGLINKLTLDIKTKVVDPFNAINQLTDGPQHLAALEQFEITLQDFVKHFEEQKKKINRELKYFNKEDEFYINVKEQLSTFKHLLKHLPDEVGQIKSKVTQEISAWNQLDTLNRVELQNCLQTEQRSDKLAKIRQLLLGKLFSEIPVLMSGHQYHTAYELCDQGLALLPQNSYFLLQKIQVLLIHGKHEEAAPLLTKLLDPAAMTDPEHQGWGKISAIQVEIARKNFPEALRLSTALHAELDAMSEQFPQILTAAHDLHAACKALVVVECFNLGLAAQQQAQEAQQAGHQQDAVELYHTAQQHIAAALQIDGSNVSVLHLSARLYLAEHYCVHGHVPLGTPGNIVSLEDLETLQPLVQSRKRLQDLEQGHPTDVNVLWSLVEVYRIEGDCVRALEILEKIKNVTLEEEIKLNTQEEPTTQTPEELALKKQHKVEPTQTQHSVNLEIEQVKIQYANKYLQRAAFEASTLKNTPKAVGLCDEGLAICPEHVPLLLMRGSLQIESNAEAAEKDLLHVLALDETQIPAYLGLAQLYYHAQEYRKTLDIIRQSKAELQALKRNTQSVITPSSSDTAKTSRETLPHSTLADLDVEKDSTIITDARQELLQTQTNHLYLLAGLAFLGLKRCDLAHRQFREILKNNPADVDAQFFLGVCLEQGQRSEAAKQQYLQLLQQTPHSQALLQYTELLRQERRSEDAIEVLTNFLKENPEHPEFAKIQTRWAHYTIDWKLQVLRPFGDAVQYILQDHYEHNVASMSAPVAALFQTLAVVHQFDHNFIPMLIHAYGLPEGPEQAAWLEKLQRFLPDKFSPQSPAELLNLGLCVGGVVLQAAKKAGHQESAFCIELEGYVTQGRHLLLVKDLLFFSPATLRVGVSVFKNWIMNAFDEYFHKEAVTPAFKSKLPSSAKSRKLTFAPESTPHYLRRHIFSHLLDMLPAAMEVNPVGGALIMAELIKGGYGLCPWVMQDRLNENRLRNARQWVQEGHFNKALHVYQRCAAAEKLQREMHVISELAAAARGREINPFEFNDEDGAEFLASAFKGTDVVMCGDLSLSARTKNALMTNLNNIQRQMLKPSTIKDLPVGTVIEIYRKTAAHLAFFYLPDAAEKRIDQALDYLARQQAKRSRVDRVMGAISQKGLEKLSGLLKPFLPKSAANATALTEDSATQPTGILATAYQNLQKFENGLLGVQLQEMQDILSSQKKALHSLGVSMAQGDIPAGFGCDVFKLFHAHKNNPAWSSELLYEVAVADCVTFLFYPEKGLTKLKFCRTYDIHDLHTVLHALCDVMLGAQNQINLQMARALLAEFKMERWGDGVRIQLFGISQEITLSSECIADYENLLLRARCLQTQTQSQNPALLTNSVVGHVVSQKLFRVFRQNAVDHSTTASTALNLPTCFTADFLQFYSNGQFSLAYEFDANHYQGTIAQLLLNSIALLGFVYQQLRSGSPSAFMYHMEEMLNIVSRLGILIPVETLFIKHCLEKGLNVEQASYFLNLYSDWWQGLTSKEQLQWLIRVLHDIPYTRLRGDMCRHMQRCVVQQNPTRARELAQQTYQQLLRFTSETQACEVLREKLRQGADADYRENNTPVFLELCINKKWPEVADLLGQYGVDFDVRVYRAWWRISLTYVQQLAVDCEELTNPNELRACADLLTIMAKYGANVHENIVADPSSNWLLGKAKNVVLWCYGTYGHSTQQIVADRRCKLRGFLAPNSLSADYLPHNFPMSQLFAITGQAMPRLSQHAYQEDAFNSHKNPGYEAEHIKAMAFAYCEFSCDGIAKCFKLGIDDDDIYLWINEIRKKNKAAVLFLSHEGRWNALYFPAQTSSTATQQSTAVPAITQTALTAHSLVYYFCSSRTTETRVQTLLGYKAKIIAPQLAWDTEETGVWLVEHLRQTLSGQERNCLSLHIPELRNLQRAACIDYGFIKHEPTASSDPYQLKAIHYACGKDDDAARVRKLVRVNPLVLQQTSGSGWHPIHHAAAYLSPNALAAVLEFPNATVDPGTEMKDARRTPLQMVFVRVNKSANTSHAYREKVRAVLRLLIMNGANTHQVDAEGFTFIQLGLGCEWLLGLFAELCAERDRLQQALLQAARKDQKQNINDVPWDQLLQYRKFPLNVCDNDGKQIIHLLSQHGQLDLLKELLANEHNSNEDSLLLQKSRGNYLPCHFAAQHLQFDCLALLAKYMPNKKSLIQQKTSIGENVLHLAVRALTNKTAWDVNSGKQLFAMFRHVHAWNERDNDGYTPFQLLLNAARNANYSAGYDWSGLYEFLINLMEFAPVDLFNTTKPGLTCGGLLRKHVEENTPDIIPDIKTAEKFAFLSQLYEFILSLEQRSQQIFDWANETTSRDSYPAWLERDESRKTYNPYYPQDVWQCQAIHRAAWQGHHRLVKILLQRNKALLFAQAGRGYLPVHHASKNGKLEVMKVIFECAESSQLEKLHLIGVETTATPDCPGETALSLAASAGHVDVVKFLLTQCSEHTHKLKPELLQRAMQNAYGHEYGHEHWEVVREFLHLNFAQQITSQLLMPQWDELLNHLLRVTPAVLQQKNQIFTEILGYLVLFLQQKNLVTQQQQSVLRLCLEKNVALSKIFGEVTADMQKRREWIVRADFPQMRNKEWCGPHAFIRNEYDCTVVHLAAWHGHADFLRTLRSNKISTVAAGGGWWPVHHAVANFQVAGLRAWLETEEKKENATAQVNQTVKDCVQDRQATPLHLAVRRVHARPECKTVFIEVVKCLLEYGADLSCVDLDGRTPQQLSAALQLPLDLQNLLTPQTPTANQPSWAAARQAGTFAARPILVQPEQQEAGHTPLRQSAG